jgi:hypothetical protein
VPYFTNCPRCGADHNTDFTPCDTKGLFTEQHPGAARCEADRAEDGTVHAYEDATATYGDVVREAERQAAERRLDVALRALAKHPTTPKGSSLTP